MQLTDSPSRRYKAVQEAKIIECVGGYYECQEVPFGVVYRWHPGYLLLECGCGARQALTCFAATCDKCGADYTSVVREKLAGQCLEDEALHPWHYAGDREGLGLPC
jgi:hypothetical protein